MNLRQFLSHDWQTAADVRQQLATAGGPNLPEALIMKAVKVFPDVVFSPDGRRFRIQAHYTE